MSIIQTQPAGQLSGSLEFNRKLYLIPPTTIQVVDSVDITSIIAVDWLVSVRDTVTNNTNVFKILAVHNDSAATHNVSSIVGSNILISTRVEIFGAFMVLEITNDISNNIEVRVQNISMNL